MLQAEVKRAVEKEADKLKRKLLGDLLGGSGQATEEEAAGDEGDQAQEEQKPEDELKNALKKLFDR
jgi:hypothetical protein